MITRPSKLVTMSDLHNNTLDWPESLCYTVDCWLVLHCWMPCTTHVWCLTFCLLAPCWSSSHQNVKVKVKIVLTTGTVATCTNAAPVHAYQDQQSLDDSITLVSLMPGVALACSAPANQPCRPQPWKKVHAGYNYRICSWEATVQATDLSIEQHTYQLSSSNRAWCMHSKGHRPWLQRQKQGLSLSSFGICHPLPWAFTHAKTLLVMTLPHTVFNTGRSSMLPRTGSRRKNPRTVGKKPLNRSQNP